MKIRPAIFTFAMRAAPDEFGCAVIDTLADAAPLEGETVSHVASSVASQLQPELQLTEEASVPPAG